MDDVRDRQRSATWLPWALVGLAVVIGTAELVVSVQNNAVGHHGVRLIDLVFPIEVFLPPVTFTVVGAFVVTRRPDNRIGWLMIAVGLGFAVTTFTLDYPGVNSHIHQPTRPLGKAVVWISTWAPTLYLVALVLLLLHFPTGRLTSPRWRWIMWLGIVAWSGAAALAAVRIGLIDTVPMDNPLGIVAEPPALTSVLSLAGFASLAGAAASILVRFRSARGDERQQLKWFTYSAALAITFDIATASTAWPAFGVIGLTATAAVPVCIGIAIMRYRLYDIDVLINRTLVYGSLTITLAALYAGGVVALQSLARTITGQSSNLSVAVMTLAVAALFNPWRHELQHLIDRRFYRRRYDAVRTLAQFSSTLRDEVDIDQLKDDMLAVTDEVMKPVFLALWLR